MLRISPADVSALMRRIEPEVFDLDYADVCRHGIDRDEPCPRCVAEALAEDHPEDHPEPESPPDWLRYGLLAVASGIGIALVIGAVGLS